MAPWLSTFALLQGPITALNPISAGYSPHVHHHTVVLQLLTVSQKHPEQAKTSRFELSFSLLGHVS